MCFPQVVLASVPSRKTFMAVKMITKRGDNTDTIMRVRRILLTARECPFLCHLYAAHQSQERAYFITEYLSGGSLEVWTSDVYISGHQERQILHSRDGVDVGCRWPHPDN